MKIISLLYKRLKRVTVTPKKLRNHSLRVRSQLKAGVYLGLNVNMGRGRGE
ncbi:hypothetical protein QUF63_16735 [Anaerolineales bacterium HSG25]|nr:hypothetical protein [Anaerolineales bacterium HSG25]